MCSTSKISKMSISFMHFDDNLRTIWYRGNKKEILLGNTLSIRPPSHLYPKARMYTLFLDSWEESIKCRFVFKNFITPSPPQTLTSSSWWYFGVSMVSAITFFMDHCIVCSLSLTGISPQILFDLPAQICVNDQRICVEVVFGFVQGRYSISKSYS